MFTNDSTYFGAIVGVGDNTSMDIFASDRLVAGVRSRLVHDPFHLNVRRFHCDNRERRGGGRGAAGCDQDIHKYNTSRGGVRWG